jgi:hypothetical protein
MPRKDQINPKLRKTVKCENCGIEFWKYKFWDKYGKSKNYFCSQKCHKAWKFGPNNPNWKGGLGKFECCVCGKRIKRKKYEIAKYKNNYCSKKCRIKGSRTHINLECECCGKKIERPKRYVDKHNHFFCDRSCRAAWMCGPNAPSWNGGTKSLKYCNAWSDKEYKLEIVERDGKHCLNPDCWKTKKMIHIHHIDYDKKNCNPNNLITLCASCNGRANIDRDWHKLWYQAIMQRRYGYKYINN